MALFKQMRGKRADLETQELHDGYAYFCVDDGSFHIDYTDADGVLQRKQINAKEAEVLAGFSLDELKALISTQDAVILHEAQSYTDAAIANIDISGGGFTIKKVEFTDRPSLYAWLQNNFDKMIKVSMNHIQMAQPLTFTDWEHHDGDDSYSFYKIYLSTGSLSFAKELSNINSSGAFNESKMREDGDVVKTQLPDEYWATLSASVTIYYIE